MPDFTPGPWPISEEDYYRDTEHVSHSMLKVFRESPPRYNGLYVAKTLSAKKSTPALTFGSRFDWKLFDHPRYAAESINRKDEALLNAMHLAALAHPVAGDVLRAKGHAQRVIRWRCPLTGLPCKAKLDLCFDGGAIVDVKTTKNPDPKRFAWDADKYGYDTQAAWYLWGASLCPPAGLLWTWLFIAVGKEPPHEVSCTELDPEDIEDAAQRNTETLEALAKCLELNVWPSNWKDIETLKLPRRKRK